MNRYIYKLRTLLIVSLLAPPLIALYVCVLLAAREVARDRDLLEAERAAFAAERAPQKAPRGTP
jgi:hypothetical protein